MKYSIFTIKLNSTNHLTAQRERKHGAKAEHAQIGRPLDTRPFYLIYFLIILSAQFQAHAWTG